MAKQLLQINKTNKIKLTLSPNGSEYSQLIEIRNTFKMELRISTFGRNLFDATIIDLIENFDTMQDLLNSFDTIKGISDYKIYK